MRTLITASIVASIASAAGALPPATAIVGYSFLRDGATRNFVAIEFADGVLPQDVQAFAEGFGGCLAIPQDSDDNFVAALSLLLIDSADPSANAAWVGIVHTPNAANELHWQTVEGGEAPFLGFGKGQPSNPPSMALGAVLHAHTQEWSDAPIGLDESSVRRAVMSFPADLEDCDYDQIPDAVVLALGLGTDIDGDGVLDWCAPPGDLNGDFVVNAADLSLLLAAWGTSGADLDGDGMTDAADLSLLLASWMW
jgi:hypothetical protein